MPKVGKQFRMSQATLEKLTWLKEKYGTETEAVAIAIERLYEAEVRRLLKANTSEPPPQEIKKGLQK